MDLRRLILGLRGLSFEPERTDFGPGRADFGLERADFEPERADFGPERGLGGVGTDVRMEGRTEGCTEFAPCVLQDIGPLGPLPKKAGVLFKKLPLLTSNVIQ